jgi:hypothetical protein
MFNKPAMKQFFLFLSILSITVCCHAQQPREKEYRFSAGVDIGHAIGYFSGNHKLGFGIFGQSEYIMSEAASFTVNASYYSFATKDVYDTVPSGIIPRPQPVFAGAVISGGLKFSITDKIYGHSQLGFVFRNDGLAATYSFGVGTQTSEHTDFSMRYQAIHEAGAGVVGSFIMVRAAYVF